MGFGQWLADRNAIAVAKRAEKFRQKEHWQNSKDPAVIESQVPELAGMTDVEGMAHTFEQIRSWRASVSAELGAELDQRLRDSQQSFSNIGLTMPYWGNLWVLRTYQHSLGLDVPTVAPSAVSGSN